MATTCRSRFAGRRPIRPRFGETQRHRLRSRTVAASANNGTTFAIDNAIDLPRFAILTPFPGTPLHRRLDCEGRILTRNWELYDGQHVVYRPSNMTPQELQAGHERAWRSVYTYGSIARRLVRSRTQLPIAIMANLGYRYYARHLATHYTCDWPIGLREAA